MAARRVLWSAGALRKTCASILPPRNCKLERNRDQCFQLAGKCFSTSARFFSSGETEVDRARTAPAFDGKPTIFSKIIDKTIPADVIFEDDKVKKKNRHPNAMSTAEFFP